MVGTGTASADGEGRAASTDWRWWCSNLDTHTAGPSASGALSNFVRVARSWRVVFRGPVSDEVLAELPDGEMLHVSGHEGVGRKSSTIWVRAADAAAAEAAVQAAITTPGCWAQYRDHVGRRHAVVHQGVDVSEADSTASLAAVQAMIAHVQQLRA